MRSDARQVAERVRAVLGEPDGDVAGRSAWWSRAVDALLVRVPMRLDPGRRGALAIGCSVLAAAILTGGWVLAHRPQASAVSSPTLPAAATPVGSSSTMASESSASAPSASAASGIPPSRSASDSASASPTPDALTSVVVDVAGRVRRPGVYRLPEGDRVIDALHAAGNQVAGVDLTSLNLAAPLADGEQITVGVRGHSEVVGGDAAGPTGDSPAAGGGTAAAAGAPVDLNTATSDQLQTLPGVGPVLAQNILDWRGAHGHFENVTQLNDVTGIGDVKFGQLKSLVRT